MRKLAFRISLLTVMVVAAAAVLPAAPACLAPLQTATTLQALIDFGVTGCQIQDKIFSNFSYVGGGLVTAPNVDAKSVLTTVGGLDIHGWSFQPSTQISSTWVVGFTLSYTIATDGVNPALRMFTSTDQMNAGLIPSGITISDTQTGVTPSPLVLTGVTTAAETIQSNPYSLTSITTTSIVDFHGGSWTLASYEQDWYESAIPEPISFVLIGTGLLGLGLLRRRVRG